MWASVMPKYGHCWLGQAKPSVCIRLGALRRLFTSQQARTGTEAGLTLEEESRQMGQSSGVRGLRRRCREVRLLPAGEWEVRRWIQQRRQCSAKQRRKSASKNECPSRSIRILTT